jgi:hypothetical protein
MFELLDQRPHLLPKGTAQVARAVVQQLVDPTTKLEGPDLLQAVGADENAYRTDHAPRDRFHTTPQVKIISQDSSPK